MSTLVAFLVCVFPIIWAADNYFCNFECGSKHTVCRRQSCLVSEACGPNSKALPFDDEDREYILDLHNEYRNTIALGQNQTGGNSEAANMQALSYDKELEYVAQCWSNACADTGRVHDVCRTTKKFGLVGQNMYRTGSSLPEDFGDRKYIKAAVKGWFNEIATSEANQIDSFKGKKSILHFTMLIWAETTRIGCARTFYRSRAGLNSIYIYCNYGDSGNILGQPVYLRGKPCSQCGEKTCNEKYKGLCGAVEELSEDKWKAPSN